MEPSLVPNRLIGGLLAVVMIFVGVGPVCSANNEVPEFLKSQTYEEPLEFVGIRVVDVRNHSVRVRWTTNHPAKARLRYGDTKKMDNTKMLANDREQQEVELVGLKEGTKYGFRIFAWDSSNHRIKSQVVFFKTKGMPKPSFKKIKVKKKSRQGGMVRWVTNIPTTSVFKAGHDTPLEFRTVHDSPTRFHEVRLDQFYPDQRVLYRITISDTRGNRRGSSLRTFRTRENNVAMSKPVRGTFDRPMNKKSTKTSQMLKRVTDGKLSFPQGTTNSGNISDTDQWFIVDLQQLHKPDTAILYWRLFAYPKFYEIYGSPFGNEWTKLAGGLNAKKGTLIRNSGIGMYKHVVPLSSPDMELRFIRVLIPKGSPYHVKYPGDRFVQLFEFKFFPKQRRKSQSNG